MESLTVKIQLFLGFALVYINLYHNQCLKIQVYLISSQRNVLVCFVTEN